MKMEDGPICSRTDEKAYPLEGWEATLLLREQLLTTKNLIFEVPHLSGVLTAAAFSISPVLTFIK